ncbi:SAM-dependent methyltransferase TehB [Leptolyngbya cf. ectocarpi LEGE 11479]|uniref:SAM-dependent methyltransferase TehB n=1 Tax=Leptolyngbya cf. ectocarpi LEGE 11479 TaxID=1828722 RepID=A0A928X1S0_LEPEC|nr:SAM-dependent methyltransferase TehB [Leptolyngbya ectocarpi]MBE9066857.1 SAM-dependent methyltransferase TehB [Leptolyngbya cf. ectocarpi LEGE 11479]
MSPLTDTLVKYKTLSPWTETTLPETFRTKHNTKPGTWAKITVQTGRLQYDALNAAGDILSTDIITSEHSDFFVEPGAWHKVTPLESLSCFVEFYCRLEDYYQKKYQFAAPHNDVRGLLQGLLSGNKKLNVLDLGCGKGRNATYLHAHGHRVTALDKNASSIHHLQTVIQQENVGNTFQAQVYDIETAALSDDYDLIISTVVFQFLKAEALPRVIENMQAKTKPHGYNFIIAPVSSLEFPCPIDFPSTFAPQALLNYYSHWQICQYQEQLGTFHRKDSSGKPIESMFATLLAQKRA